MEQTTNHPMGEQEEQARDSWRSFGSIARGLTARAEARMASSLSGEDHPVLPVAWAAE